MRISIVFIAVLTTGCVTPQFGVDPFDREPEFAAQRELETTVLPATTVASAAAQVVEVLMDYDCSFVEIDGAVGVVSARGEVKAIAAPDFLLLGVAPTPARILCGRASVTVALRPRGEDVAVRATFDPPDLRRDETFRRLLMRSIERRTEEAR